MKKITFAGAMILSLLACNRIEEEQPEQFQRKELTVTAFRADNDTKTARQADGCVYWSPGDAISLFFRSGENGGSKFTAQNSEEVAIAQFKGTIDVISGGGEDSGGEFWFWGVYPYSAQNSCDGSSITTVIPAQQVGKAGTFADNTFITMARAKGLELGFYNICSGVKFTLTRDDIKEVRIRGNNGEDIAGKIKVEWDSNGKPAINQYVEGAKEVCVTAPGGGTFAIGTEYYLVLAPTLFSQGFTLSLITSDYQRGDFVYENSRQFKRGIFVNISTLDSRVDSWVQASKASLPSSILPNGVDRNTITEVNFYVNSDKTTSTILSSKTGYEPIYFELNGTVANYYTKGEAYELPNWSGELFRNFNQLKELDLRYFDTQNVKWMDQMFLNCNSLEFINLSSFNTANVTSMLCMFQSCTKLRQLDLSSFNTSKVESMGAMFERCFSMEYLDISTFNYSNCAYCGNLFSMCQNLMYLDMGEGDLPQDGIDYLCQKYALGIPYCFIRCTNSSRENLQQSKTQLDVAKVHWVDVNDAMPPYVSYRDPALYYSSDYSKDKRVTVVQTSSTGKGADLIFIGDAYTDRLIDDGTYDNDIDSAIEAVFSVEPMASYRSLFNIYKVYAVSETEVVGNNTALHTKVGGDGYMMSDSYVCNSYAAIACPGTGIDGMGTTFNNATIIVVINSENDHGISYTTISANPGDYVSDYGQSCEAMAFVGKGINETFFRETVLHEFGHAFAKLADEYYSTGEMDENAINYMRQYDSNTGYNKNVDYSNDPLTIKWHRFLSDSRYDGAVGIFEGGHASYDKGVWRPTEDSIMKCTTGQFNAPSREAIYYRIHKLAYGEEWVYDYETFVQQDLKNIPSSPAPVSAKRASSSVWNNRKHIFKMEESIAPDGKKMLTITTD